jgi:hypothetical protein
MTRHIHGPETDGDVYDIPFSVLRSPFSVPMSEPLGG